MPLTVKLSRQFYDRFGEELVNELVDLLNQVDATYRAELREVNELNFARLDAKLEQRTGELRAELRAGLATLEARLTGRIDSLEARLPVMLSQVDAQLRAYVEKALKDQGRWFIAAWAALIASNIALWFR